MRRELLLLYRVVLRKIRDGADVQSVLKAYTKLSEEDQKELIAALEKS